MFSVPDRCPRMSSNGSDGYPSPVITRKDAIAFTIPQTYHGSPVSVTRNRGLTELHMRTPPPTRGLCARPKTKSMEDISGNICRPCIGQLCMEIWFSQDDELLMIRLVRVDLIAKPNPAAIGSNWDIKPEVKVCLLHKKRSFWDSGQNKAPCTLVPHTATFVPIKRDAVQEQCLRLTVFDGLRQNDKTPIGFVFVRLSDLDLSWKSSSYVREIVPSSEFAGFSTGKIQVKLQWDPPTEKLHIAIERVGALKSPHGTLKRFFFTRIFVFIKGVEIKQIKSNTHQADPDLYFDSDCSIDLKSNQINESCILIQLYAKVKEILSFTPELIGSTIIGPYMPKVFNLFTHWENMIANPLEDVTGTHDLFL